MALVFFAITILSCFKEVTSHAHDHCIGTCYSGRLLPEPKDIFRGKHLKGFCYKNITTDDPKKCYSSCIQDCRCKACQMKDERCELLDEDKTSKAGNFTSASGYVYYDLKQTMYQGKSHMVPPGVCYNGCCRYNPCLNGGTCTEHCQSTKEKFTCLCTKHFTGKVCEKPVYYSCMDVMVASAKHPVNEVYFLRRSDKIDKEIPVYCSFVEPNQAWTLVESFSLEKNPFKAAPFYKEHSSNNNSPPQWDSYRMGLSRMQYFRSKSTLFRSTCDFPKRNGSLTPDLLIGSLSDVDIINVKSVYGCKKYKLINIRGHQCTDCTAMSYNDRGHQCTDCTARSYQGWSYSGHYYLDITYETCEFRPPHKVESVDSFGYYATIESESICTAILDDYSGRHILQHSGG